MPYYLFAIKPFGQLELLGTHDAFKAASAQAKALRAEQGPDAPRIKVMFGTTQLEAEDQLCQLRERQNLGDDD